MIGIILMILFLGLGVDLELNDGKITDVCAQLEKVKPGISCVLDK